MRLQTTGSPFFGQNPGMAVFKQQLRLASSHRPIMPSCHHAIMPSCHHAIMPSCHPVACIGFHTRSGQATEGTHLTTPLVRVETALEGEDGRLPRLGPAMPEPVITVIHEIGDPWIHGYHRLPITITACKLCISMYVYVSFYAYPCEIHNVQMNII